MKKRTIASIFALVIATVTISPALIQAQTDNPLRDRGAEKGLDLPSQPDIDRPSGRRVGAANRDPSGCPTVEKPLTALVPEPKENLVLGSTVNERPTFLFYVPYNSKELSARFVLRDKDGYIQPPIDIPLPDQPGVIEVALNPDSKTLEVDKEYYWTFTIYCNPEDRMVRESVYGIIERKTPPNELMEIIDRSQYPKYQAYLEHDMWYDGLSDIARRIRENPTDEQLKNDWQDALSKIDLVDIASEPIVD